MAGRQFLLRAACQALRGGSRAANAPASSSSVQQWLLSCKQRSALPGWPAAPHLWLLRSYASLPAHQVLMMPSLSPTMTQGNIAAWRKKEGDAIGPGDIIAEVETDKATIEWEAQEEGYIAKIVKPAGSKEIPVGATVALLVEDEGDVAAFKDYNPDDAAAPAAAAAPKAAAPAPAPAAAAAAAPSSSYPPHEVLKMPALSPTMTQGNILQWAKAPGDTVAPGDVLCEVETDKATISWEAQEEGYLAAILLPNGAKDVPVGNPAAVLVEDQDLVAAFAKYTAADAAGAPAAAAPAASAPPPPAAKPAAAPKPAPAAAAAAPARAAAPAPGGRVVASPYAKKLAADAGVSLAGVAGSGPGGRVVASDVQQLIASGGAAPAAAAAAAAGGYAAAAAPAGGYTDVPVSQIKRITAERLLMSKQTIPHYYLTMECRMEALLKLRAQINDSLASDGVKLSVNDFIVKAAALALRKVPEVNASWQGDVIRQFHNVDVNVAVASPAGLMVPFVRDADAKPLHAISTEVKALAAKAKDNKLQPHEFMGGTFTISNLGMFGIKQFAAIVNPPQAAILAVGATSNAVVKDGAGGWKEAPVMLVTLSCDHRVIDGAVGAQWLAAFKALVEAPLGMLV